ncbi:hypothetical protein LPN01_05860 [Sphingomonas sp. A2-49]|uniref:hypothetical protein n=1 Tax=Sphingomonas sp. A2-49 TaxID=1391375 RepID=UPI0021D2CE92|nr:hypothetical protein [Sphingomonas sp. A2-49]MCU6453595.1 hypothetical protein [Sphingomonas sp. A2-49]
MPMPADMEYYARRERQEMALADRAGNAEGRRVHLEMARRYASLIAEHPAPDDGGLRLA